MLYYTQLIFVIPGMEPLFHDFEDAVLPLLTKHNAELVLRIRPQKESVIAHTGPLPYEVHLVSFENEAGFKGYVNDPLRLAFLDLKNKSVEKIVLIEGRQV